MNRLSEENESPLGNSIILMKRIQDPHLHCVQRIKIELRFQMFRRLICDSQWDRRLSPSSQIQRLSIPIRESFFVKYS